MMSEDTFCCDENIMIKCEEIFMERPLYEHEKIIIKELPHILIRKMIGKI